MFRTRLAALAAVPVLAAPLAAVGCTQTVSCTSHSGVSSLGPTYPAWVGFNCGGATVQITGSLNRTTVGRPNRFVYQTWSGRAGGNGAAFGLYIPCRSDGHLGHFQYVSARAYYNGKLAGAYESPTVSTGYCG